MRWVFTGGSRHDKGGTIAGRRLRRIGLGAVGLGVAVVLLITQIGAASTPRAHAATVNTYRVPGVINASALATYFACTNGGTAEASVTVSVFDKGGTEVATETLSIAAKGSALLGTSAAGGLKAEPLVLSPTFTVGSAKISAPTGVFCAAFLADTTKSPPDSMVSLPVIKGTAQKGV